MPTESRRWSAFHAARTGNVRLRVPASAAASIPSPIKRESECASLGDSLGALVGTTLRTLRSLERFERFASGVTHLSLVELSNGCWVCRLIAHDCFGRESWKITLKSKMRFCARDTFAEGVAARAASSSGGTGAERASERAFARASIAFES